MKSLKFFLFLAFFAWLSPSSFAQTSGGPDAYGYTWKNSSHTSNPPSYNWVDITTRGDQVTGLADDNVVGPFPIPAGFQYYWYPVSQIWIGSNGYISFNGVNMASPFPSSVPSPAGGNDWLAPHMADLNFSGSNNPAQCYFYANQDSLVVSFINVPYWSVTAPGYSGSNSFQIVWTKADKHIQFNYQSLSSAGATSQDCVTGIENVTGALGLQNYIDVVPSNSFAIKYYYPSVVTYAVTDGGVNWNKDDRNGGYFIPVNSMQNFQTNIKNFGNQALPAFTATDTIYSVLTPIVNGSVAVPALQPGEDTTLTFSNTFMAQFPAIFKLSSRVSGISGDMVAANNRKTTKIVAVSTNQTQYTLDYSDGIPDGTGLSWNGGGGGIGVYIEPPVYPAQINGCQFLVTAQPATPVGCSVMLYDDNGPGGTQGTLLDSMYIQPSNIFVGSYTTVMFNNAPFYKTSGGYYLVWYMGGSGITIGRDLTPPTSQQSYEILGSTWAHYRDMYTEDFCMGLLVSNAPFPAANFTIDTTQMPLISFTDISTNSPTTWHWDFGYNNDTSVVQNPSYTYTQNGTYTVCLAVTNTLGSDTVCKTVTIRGIGIDESAELQWALYPNPTTGQLTLQLPRGLEPKAVMLRITNLLGQNIPCIWSVEGSRLRTDLPTASGMYLLELYDRSSGRSLGVQRVVVE
ncbi:MAG: PKD domain-containing protein [Bacteroidetes bacterium]|nr:PKD domain-containing protein [Bacteroidota bacterium]MDA0828709.1 PKD domain-containing protein [Bacteroidota bacterium]MDA1199819.1 PKD domain-containing protein [Bacteroidota bacterium]